MVKKFRRKAASASCHPSRRRMDSSDLHPIVHLAHMSQRAKRHLDRFSRFRRARERNKQTDTQTDRPTTLLTV